jgi:hypothetical protein
MSFEQIQTLKERMQRSIIGQEAVVGRLIIGLLANGNLLVEGLQGLRSFARAAWPAGIISQRLRLPPTTHCPS